MAQRRPITSHPAFVPLVALWFAALLGLGVAVLPAVLLVKIVTGAGLTTLLPPTTAGRLASSGAAALAGALLGWVLALILARRGMRDPRPIYDEPEPPFAEPPLVEPARRRLLARDDLPDDTDHGTSEALDSTRGAQAQDMDSAAPPLARAGRAGPDEGFMILGPQPAYSQHAAPDLDALLDQFDNALAAFRAEGDADEDGNAARRSSDVAAPPDPVHEFIARQTGTSASSPLGGPMPDHQAELRATLDKLARAKRED